MERRGRIKALQDKLGEAGLYGVLLFYSRDIFYYTGTAQPSYLAVLPGDHRLFVRSGVDFALNDVFIDVEKVKEERRLENIRREFFPDCREGTKIATETDVLTVEQWLQFKKAFPGCEFADISPLVLEQRMAKRRERSTACARHARRSTKATRPSSRICAKA